MMFVYDALQCTCTRNDLLETDLLHICQNTGALSNVFALCLTGNTTFLT